VVYNAAVSLKLKLSVSEAEMRGLGNSAVYLRDKTAIRLVNTCWRFFI
jgi:hypothetical protein